MCSANKFSSSGDMRGGVNGAIGGLILLSYTNYKRLGYIGYGKMTLSATRCNLKFTPSCPIIRNGPT